MPGLFGEFLIIFALTLANGFFSGAEIAVVQSRRNRLEEQAEAGSAGARKALALAAQPDRFLATVQVGITLISTFSAAFGGARLAAPLAEALVGLGMARQTSDTIALLIVVALITYLSLVFGELVPKRLALQNAERLAIFAAPFLTVLATIAHPITVFLSASVQVVSRLLGIDRIQARDVTEADIMSMVREGAQSGAVEADQAEFIEQVFRLSYRPVRAIMTPRSEIISLQVEATLEQAVAVFEETHFSRIPVCEGPLDNVVGVLNAKDLVRFAGKPAGDFRLRELLLTAQFVPESARSDDVLDMLRDSGTHLALVIDEYGAVTGLVTMEDVLEELVGEIRDEYDQAEEAELVARDDGTWLVDGGYSVERLDEAVGGDLLTDDLNADFTTVAGLILTVLNRIPVEGDKVRFGHYELEVIDMDGRRVDKLLIRALPLENGDEATSAS
jgi:putative hemolysin